MKSRCLKRGFATIDQLGKWGSRYLLDSFLQKGCATCDRATTQPFCLDCRRQLIAQIGSDRPSTAIDQLPVKALGTYDGILKRAILALKYENRPETAQLLGSELAQKWMPARLAKAKQVYVLPIPLHAKRQQERGYNQAALIARSFCQVSGLRMIENGLVRSQATAPQHQLGREARQRNLADAFEVDHWLSRLRTKAAAINVLLVDDIYTTGTTVQSAAKTLAGCGISTVGVAVVARA